MQFDLSNTQILSHSYHMQLSCDNPNSPLVPEVQTPNSGNQTIGCTCAAKFKQFPAKVRLRDSVFWCFISTIKARALILIVNWLSTSYCSLSTKSDPIDVHQQASFSSFADQLNSALRYKYNGSAKNVIKPLLGLERNFSHYSLEESIQKSQKRASQLIIMHDNEQASRNNRRTVGKCNDSIMDWA